MISMVILSTIYIYIVEIIVTGGIYIYKIE
jgi:hypothetical protein